MMHDNCNHCFLLIQISLCTIKDMNEDVGGDNGKEYSPLFLKLRAQSIKQVTELMDSTINSMYALEKSIGKLNTSTSGMTSTARIWSSFYDPKMVEKLRKGDD